MKIDDKTITNAVGIAHHAYRRALVDPTSVQPWHACTTEYRLAFTEACVAMWNIAMHEANCAFVDIATDHEQATAISRSLAELQVPDRV